MLTMISGPETSLPLVISLVLLIWLSMCAIFDIRTHKVPNWITLPAIPVAIIATWITRENSNETLYSTVFHLFILMLPLFIAWRMHLIGGADLKILLVLALASSQLFFAAWIGALVYFLGFTFFSHKQTHRFAGVPGFALGIGFLTIGQLVSLFLLRSSI